MATVTVSVPGSASSALPTSRGEIVSVQYLRGLAALMVVIYHILGFDGFGLPQWRIGNQGVDVFFVISGFIMWTTAQNLSPRRFFVRRLVRLIPLYWFFIFLMAATSPIFGGSSLDQHRITLKTTLLSLLFIPFHVNFDPSKPIFPILAQGWTLNYEMVFYVCFAFALLLPTRRARAASIVLGLGSLCLVGWLAPPANPILYVMTHSIMIEFLFGIGVAALVRHLPSHYPHAWVALLMVAWILLIASGHAEMNRMRFLVVGIPAASLVLAAVALEPMFRRRPVRLLRTIGDASYALYLCHSFVLKACALVLLHIPHRILPVGATGRFTVFLACGLAACVLTAVVIHQALERPVTRWLNEALGLRGRATVPGNMPAVPA